MAQRISLQSLEKELGKVRNEFRSRTQTLLSEVEKSPVVKRVQALRKDAEKQIGSTVDEVLAVFQIASKSDVEKMDKKIRTLTKKLSSLEKGSAPQAPEAQH